MAIKVISEVEDELEAVLAHIRAILEKNPDAPITINPPADQTIKVGGVHPDSATPSGGHKKP